MVILKGSEFYRIGRTDLWRINLDISVLRDFTALEESDEFQLVNAGLTHDIAKVLRFQSDMSIGQSNEGKRVPITISVSPYKLGRILSKNSELIELDTTDVPEEVLEEVTNGILYETEIEKTKPTMMAYYSYKFKTTMYVGGRSVEESAKGRVDINAYYC